MEDNEDHAVPLVEILISPRAENRNFGKWSEFKKFFRKLMLTPPAIEAKEKIKESLQESYSFAIETGKQARISNQKMSAEIEGILASRRSEVDRNLRENSIFELEYKLKMAQADKTNAEALAINTESVVV